MIFNDFVHEYKLKSEATSKTKIYQMLSSLSLSDVGVSLKDCPFERDAKIVTLHPLNGIHLDFYINHYYFDSPKNFPDYMKSKHRKFIYSEYRNWENEIFVPVMFCIFFVWQKS